MVMAYPGPPRRAAGRLRYLLLAFVLLALFYYLRNSSPRPPFNSSQPQTSHPPSTSHDTSNTEHDSEDLRPIAASKTSSHPIDTLIEAADRQFDELLKKETHDVTAAAVEYRRSRGRHPPPGFDTWFKFAQENEAVIVEDFFDQIYHDLNPFWAVPPSKMRDDAASYEMKISVRNHKAGTTSDWFWTQMWLNLTQTIEHLLPDVDIALNAMDEPRIVVPWEEIKDYIEIERKTRSMPPTSEVVSTFQILPEPLDVPHIDVPPHPWENTKPYWKIASRGCHPNSLTRQAALRHDFSQSPAISLTHTIPHTYEGYVSNFTLAKDFCHQPDLQGLHGMMIEPLSISATDYMFPLFGGSKLPTNNEILLPAPMYWNPEERFSGGNDHGGPWTEKLDKVVWRGVATGGRNKPGNWRGFQRHRFVAMTNGTKIKNAESWTSIPQNWALPTSQYNLAAQQENRLGEWTGEWTDTGFTDLMCEVNEPERTCKYTDAYFSLTPPMTMGDQFARKYLPDIDGNSFSGRYRGFLMSTSLPIKATIFKEWHDSRLVPWKHFIPMDNRFMDFWGIMEYFLGYEGENIKVQGHDREAERMAMAGQEWANKVLRREDMQIYVLRLLLEYARLCDDKRDKLGWVEDLF